MLLFVDVDSNHIIHTVPTGVYYYTVYVQPQTFLALLSQYKCKNGVINKGDLDLRAVCCQTYPEREIGFSRTDSTRSNSLVSFFYCLLILQARLLDDVLTSPDDITCMLLN